MNDMDLQKAMTDINPEFILEAAPDREKAQTIPMHRRRVFRGAVLAAAACLFLAVSLNVTKVKRNGDKNEISPVSMEEAGEASDAYEAWGPDNSAGEASGEMPEQEKAVPGAEEETELETETDTDLMGESPSEVFSDNTSR